MSGADPRLEYRDGSLWHAVLVAVRSIERYETTEERIASALRSHILSVCLFCGAIAGALPVEARRLIAAYCAGDADALLGLADLVEECGLTGPHAQWAEEQQGWLEATEHKHVWLPWVSGDEERATFGITWQTRGIRGVRRCTCGMFEHEHAALRQRGMSEEGAHAYEDLRRRYSVEWATSNPLTVTYYDD